jgi:fluoride exporter
MITILTWIGVGVFGGIGALARFRVAGGVTARWPSAFPYGTFVVNVSGGFTLGLLTGLGVSDGAMLVFGTGLLGGYTTFSTWMVETERLGEDASWVPMSTYLFGSMLAGLVAGGAGWLLGGELG